MGDDVNWNPEWVQCVARFVLVALVIAGPFILAAYLSRPRRFSGEGA